jgi:hypothetical protein
VKTNNSLDPGATRLETERFNTLRDSWNGAVGCKTDAVTFEPCSAAWPC